MQDPDAPRRIDVAIWPNRVHAGVGAAAALSQLCDDLGCRRALVLCGGSVARSELLGRVERGLGDRLAGVFSEVKAHTPLAEVRRAVDRVRELDADLVVSVGGGSAIDAGKGVCLLLSAEDDLQPYAIRYASAGMARARLTRRAIRHIAVPTTAGSASDVMPTSAIRDLETRRKMLFWDDLLIPDTVVLDPEMAALTNPFLTAASGMTAVARCVEALYSSDRNPVATGLALHALRLLARSLPIATREPGNLAARAECQYACTMSGIAAINAMVSVVHAVGHIVGGRYGLQHGTSHAVLLAPAMRQLLPVLGEDQHLVLAALKPQADAASGSADAAGQRAADAMAELVASLPLRQTLRELDIPEPDLASIATDAEHDYMMANVPVSLAASDIARLVRSVW